MKTTTPTCELPPSAHPQEEFRGSFASASDRWSRANRSVLGSAVLLAGLSLGIAHSRANDFELARRIASTMDPDGELAIGLTLDDAASVYVTGWFDGTNDFGGVTLTSRGGQDIFVAKYGSGGALEWVRRAGGSFAGEDNHCAGGSDRGRGIGVDGEGNVYVTGGFFDDADFGEILLSAPLDNQFFLVKYDMSGVVQWVQHSMGGRSCGVYGTGLAVDREGNSYAVGYVDGGAPIAFSSPCGTANLPSPDDTGYSAFLVKYDNSGCVEWAELMGGPGQTYTTSVAVDRDGKVYVSGSFSTTLMIGNMELIGSDPMGQTRDMFLAKFDGTGAVLWVKQAGGGDDRGGGVAVDQDRNVVVSGGFEGAMSFGNGIALEGAGDLDAFIARYDSDGAPQWAKRAGGESVYLDSAVDLQGNVYGAGVLGPNVAGCGPGGAAVAKYDRQGTLQWATSASSPPADPVGSVAVECAVDAAGNCYLAGWYRTRSIFGVHELLPQPDSHWNFFLAKLRAPVTPPSTKQCFLRGDCNDDGIVDIADAVCTFNWLFLGGATPGCIAATNTNGDAGADISDAVYVLTHLFLGGPVPVAPFPECGLGTLPTDEETCVTPPEHCRQ